MNRNSPSASPVETHYAEFFGAIADMAPGLLHLHYGVCDSAPTTPWHAFRALAHGPAALLDALWDAGEVARLPAGARGLDLGCGLGGTSSELARRFGLRMAAMDRTRSQARRAHQRLRRLPHGDRVAVAQASGVALPFASRAFQLAVTIEVLFHVADKPAVFAEVARVLAPGGCWLIVDQENHDAGNGLSELFHFAERGDIERLGARVGLALAREVDLSPGVARWMGLYARMAAPAWQAALVPLALARGGPALARRYLRGIRTYEQLVLENAARSGLVAPDASARGAIRRLRLHTQRCLEDGSVAYKIWVLRRDGAS
ncbi:MAG: methyltransferase domain-containing protein [bacterium]